MALSAHEVAEHQLQIARLENDIRDKTARIAEFEVELKRLEETPGWRKKKLKPIYLALFRKKGKKERERQNLLSKKFRLQTALGTARPEEGFSETRGMRDHQAFFEVDLIKRVASLLAAKEETLGKDAVVHVCDLSAGQGRALWQLKKYFGDRVITHGTYLRTQPPTHPKFKTGIDLHYPGDNLNPKSGFRQSTQKFDLMLSRRGAYYAQFHHLRGAVLSKLAPKGWALVQFSKRHWPVIKKLMRRIEARREHGTFSVDLISATEPGEEGKVPALRIYRHA